MLPLPSFFAPTAVGAGLLNQLLRREAWAQERLSRHSGKTVRFVIGRAVLSFTIESSGRVQACDLAIVPDVTLTISADQLARVPAILRSKNVNDIAALLHVEGDAGLATLVSELARDLRWDVESDLAQVVGDVAAVRLVRGCKALVTGARDSAERLSGNVSEYLTEEGKWVLGRSAYTDWKDRVQSLQHRLDRLEQRVDRLQSPAPHRSAQRI